MVQTRLEGFLMALIAREFEPRHLGTALSQRLNQAPGSILTAIVHQEQTAAWVHQT